MKKSAGILLVYNKKLLLAHPSNSSWTKGTYSPPKGLSEKSEELIDTAIRECWEEVSVKIYKYQIKNKEVPIVVDYKEKNGEIFKKVYLFIVQISDLGEVGLDSEVIDKSKLQIEEVDWCGFLTKKEAEIKILWRFKDILNIIL